MPARTILSMAILFSFAGLIQTSNAQTAPGYQPPKQVDGSRGTQENAKPTQGDKTIAPNQLATEQAFDQLVTELDNLIPGEFVEGSPQKKAVIDAVTAFQLRDATRVVEILKAQAAVDPDFPPTDLLLAALSFAIQDAKSGRVLLERAGFQNPTSPAVYSAFSRLAINEGRAVDALALLEKMARVMKTSKLSANSKGFYDLQYLDGMSDVAMRQQRYDDARAFLAKQRELAPQNAKVLMVSAELEFKQDNLPKAMDYLNQLRAKIPQTRVPESIIASWFQRTGKQDEAKTWIMNAAEKYGDNPQVQLEVASWAVNEEEFPLASAAIKKAETNGEVPLSKSLKAKIAFSNGAFSIAESHYEQLTKLQPDNFDFANMYALCLIESQDEAKRKKALEIAQRNFRALPNNVVSQAALGFIQLRSGDIEQAKSALGRALKTNNASPEIRYFGATVLKAIEQPENAKTVLEAALQHKGLFMYRNAAKKLLAELNASAPAAAKN